MAAIFEKYTHSKDQPNVQIADIRPEVLKRRFLELYVLVGNIQKTCDMLGMCRRTVYFWRQTNPEFKKAFEEADALSLELLEDEAHRRGVLGVDKPVYQGGKFMGYVKDYSDTLLIVLLKARAPEKYRERFEGKFLGADGKPMSPQLTINHVHSAIPIAMSEDTVTDIPYEIVKQMSPVLPPSTAENKDLSTEQLRNNLKQDIQDDELLR